MNSIQYDRKVLVNVLVYHWRTKTSGCGCGWNELGLSHPEHLADVYELLSYFDCNIAPTLGNIPQDGMTFLRKQYVEDARRNPEALRQVREWAAASGESC